MDADFAGLVEKVNNFSGDGIFASDNRFDAGAVDRSEIEDEKESHDTEPVHGYPGRRGGNRYFIILKNQILATKPALVSLVRLQLFEKA